MAEKKAEQQRARGHEWPPDETREHFRAARKAFRHSFKTLLPPDFIKHRRKARREMLLAARSLIDHALEKLETLEET